MSGEPDDLERILTYAGAVDERFGVEEIGADAYVYGRALRDGVAPPLEDQAAPLVVRVDGRAAPRAGSTLHLAADPDQVHVFDAASGLRLG